MDHRPHSGTTARNTLVAGLLGLLGLGAALGGCGGDDPPATQTPTAAQGEMIAARLVCANCHESETGTDGTLSGATTPRPGTMQYGSNLTPDRTTGIGAWTDAQIIAALREGVDETGRRLCPSMPRYPQLTDVELRSLVLYLRSIPAVNRTIPTSSCP